MTTIYEVSLQLWVGSTDVNGMLTEIGGWHVGSYAALEAADAVRYALGRGWVQQRVHCFPDGARGDAYELTDSGLEQLRRSYGSIAADRAERARQWYRDRVS